MISARSLPVLPARLRPTAAVRTTVAAVLLGLVGGWLGLTLGGTVHHEVGPLSTSMRVLPTWSGGTTVDIPPLGELVLDTHDAPLGVRARLVGVDIDEARAIMQDPAQLETLRETAEGDLRWELLMAAGRALLMTLLGAACLSVLALRSVRGALLGTGAAACALLTAGALAVASWSPAALAEPRYTGLLTSAPTLVGDADRIVDDLSLYSDQLAGLVENVTGLYAVTTDLPVLPAERDVVRVLHVSDLHLAPHTWDVVRSVAARFRVDVVVDSGDITDHGSVPENRYLQEIRHLAVPYVWVRGNHDSMHTERAMRRIDNVVVLDGRVRNVAGLRFLGGGDPTFTPDKSEGEHDQDVIADVVAAEAERLAATAERVGGVDLAVFHDPKPMKAFDGLADVTLSGHQHYRKVTRGEQGTWLTVQGSTGGSGLRALEPEEPASIDLSVLYLDQESGELLAYDDISLGGLGLASAQITREVVDGPEQTQLVAPRPTLSR